MKLASKSKMALIDPRPLMRISISRLLETSISANSQSEGLVIVPFSDPDELLSQHFDPGDFEMVIFNTGATCVCEEPMQKAISRLVLSLSVANTPLVLLTDHDEPCDMLATLRNGVRGYIPTTLNPSVIIQALHLVLAGGSFIPAETIVTHFENLDVNNEKERFGTVKLTPPQDLTPRQLEVLQLLQQGKSNKVIAYELGAQESTIKVHIRQIMRKLKAKNRTQAALFASHVTEMQGDTIN